MAHLGNFQQLNIIIALLHFISDRVIKLLLRLDTEKSKLPRPRPRHHNLVLVNQSDVTTRHVVPHVVEIILVIIGYHGQVVAK